MALALVVGHKEECQLDIRRQRHGVIAEDEGKRSSF